MDDQAVIRTYGNKNLPEGTEDIPSLNYIFVYGNMNEYGGIQSILIRLSAYLAGLGHMVTLANVHGKLLESEDIKARIIPHQDKNAHMEIAKRVKGDSPSEVIILAFDPSSAAVGYKAAHEITCRSTKKVRFGVGVFHPRDFFREQEKRHVHLLNFMLSLFLRSGQFVFMNLACKRSHEKFLRRNLSESITVPVPIDKRKRMWNPPDANEIRICSVGRIVPFKAYNFSAPEIVSKINAHGHCAVWDIYGHGTHEKRLVELLNQFPEARTKFCGPLPLTEFDRAVSQYDVFVGMGTAALQAAQLGVPTVLAVDQEPHRTYGFLHEAPFGNVGELEVDAPTETIFQKLLQFCEMTPDSRLALSQREEAAAGKYDVESFVGRLSDLPLFDATRRRTLGALYCSVYLWTMQDSAIRRAYRAVTRRKLRTGLHS